MIGQLLRFGLVGAAAAFVHFFATVALVRWFSLDPQYANLCGFLLAFVVSFIGQWRWTFGGARAPLRRALPAFFLIAWTAFAVNALAYRWLLLHTGLRYDVALALVLIAVAALTFVSSRLWAFRGLQR